MLKLLNAKMTIMKKLRDKIEHYILQTEDHWKSLRLEQQRLLTKVFFGSYVLMTFIVIINICISKDKRFNTMSINHIDGISKKPLEKGLGHTGLIQSTTKK